MVVGVFIRDHSLFAPRQRTKQRMSRPCALTRARPDSLQQLKQRRALFFKRCRNAGFQLGSRRSSFRKRKYIEDELLEWKYLKRALVCGGYGQISQSHARRQAKMLQHFRYAPT